MREKGTERKKERNQRAVFCYGERRRDEYKIICEIEEKVLRERKREIQSNQV